MPQYRRVSPLDRALISTFLKSGLLKSDIAVLLGLHKSTIGREIRRNSVPWGYRALEAQRLSKARQDYRRRARKIDEVLAAKIWEKTKEGWSPEQIAHRFRKEQVAELSHQAIYQYFDRDFKRRREFKLYRRRPPREGVGRHLQRKRKNESLLRIAERPVEAQERRRIGDWERDTMFTKDRRMILVCTDRKTRYTCMGKLENFRSRYVYKQTVSLLQPLQRPILTITQDNAPEFRDSDLFEKSSTKLYYCDPKRPQQRGTVENTIGLIRQYIKRNTCIENLSGPALRKIQDRLNHRPRKCLDYQTPYEAFFHTRVALVT